MTQEHEKVINAILQDEEELISMHREHIDDIVEMAKEEMNIINEVDRPGSDIQIYANSLENILHNKEERIKKLLKKLEKFKLMLREEEALSFKFMECQETGCFD